MDPNAAVPTPASDQTGVDGTQVAGNERDVDTKGPPLVGEYLGRAFIDLAADQPDSFGGDLNAPMITAMINQCIHDKSVAQDEAADKQVKLEALSEELATLKTELAVARAQMESSVLTNRVQKVCAFLSPVCLSFGIDLYKAQFTLSVVAFVVGLVLLAVNFIPSRGKGQ